MDQQDFFTCFINRKESANGVTQLSWRKCDDNVSGNEWRNRWWRHQGRINEMLFQCSYYNPSDSGIKGNEAENQRNHQAVHCKIWDHPLSGWTSWWQMKQTQNGEMMFYAGTLHEPLRKKLLKKMHSNYRPQTLREAFRPDTGIQKGIPGYSATIWI